MTSSSYWNINNFFLREALVVKEVKRWSAQSEATLQDALANMNRDMFQACADDINKFADVAVSFISMVAGKIVPTVRLRSFPSQKLARSIPVTMNTRTTAYNTRLTTGDRTPLPEHAQEAQCLLLKMTEAADYGLLRPNFLFLPLKILFYRE